MKKIRNLFQQFFRFGIVGILCFGIDYGLMVLLTEFGGISYIYSSGISFAVSVIVNYVLSMRFVFHGKEDMSKFTEMAIFVLLSVIGLFFNQMIMWIIVELYGVFYLLAKLVATVTVTMYNFVSRKIFLE